MVPLIFGVLGSEILGGGRGGPTHWTNLRTLLFQEAAAGSTDGPIASLLPDEMTWPTLFAAALDGAFVLLTERVGDYDSETWSWGSNHTTNPTHPLSRLDPGLAKLLDPPAVAMGGGFDTPNAASYSTAKGNQYNITGLSVNRYIHDPSDWRKSRWIAPLGASGHPGSPHYSDQAALWANVETIPQLWYVPVLCSRACG